MILKKNIFIGEGDVSINVPGMFILAKHMHIQNWYFSHQLKKYTIQKNIYLLSIQATSLATICFYSVLLIGQWQIHTRETCRQQFLWSPSIKVKILIMNNCKLYLTNKRTKDYKQGKWFLRSSRSRIIALSMEIFGNAAVEVSQPNALNSI